MKVHISSNLLHRLHAAAAATPDQETCGLLLGRGARIEDVVVAANVAATPATHFEVDPAALITAHKKARVGGLEVVGNWHSHPQGRAEPSAEDARCAAPDGQIWIILGQEGAQAWRAVDAGPRHGRFEQVALAVV
ncbi:MAG: M67 family metallopeptidase [Chakrabartia sp.]